MKKLYIWLIVFMLVIIGAASLIYSKCNVNPIPILNIDNDCKCIDVEGKTYQDGLDEGTKLGRQQARERLSVTGFCPPYNYTEITKIEGEIKAISGNNILVLIKPIGPLSHPDLDERLVNLKGNIKGFHMKEKKEDIYMKERADFDKIMAEYIKDSSKFEKSPTFPDFFTREEINIDYSKLGTGMRVMIETDKDIRYEKKINPISFGIKSFSRDPSFKIDFDKGLSILDFVETEEIVDIVTGNNILSGTTILTGDNE